MIDWFEKGGPVMWPLLGLSVVALTVVVERALVWLRAARTSPRELLRACVAARPAEPVTEAALEECVSAEQRRLERGMTLLDTVITTAPLLGILGTVLGIIDSFELLSARTDADPMAVSGGVAEALITTATGLAITLVAIFPYNGFRARLRLRIEACEQEARSLLARSLAARTAGEHALGDPARSASEEPARGAPADPARGAPGDPARGAPGDPARGAPGERSRRAAP